MTYKVSIVCLATMVFFMTYGDPMKFFNEDVIYLAQENTYYRKVLFTTNKSQLVLMSVPAGTEIPKEVHEVDQLLYFVKGSGEAVLHGKTTLFTQHHMLIIPSGTTHTIKNTGTSDLKIISLYTPPEHAPGTVHITKEDDSH